MKDSKFVISVPLAQHAVLAETIGKLQHVAVHSESKTGVVLHEGGAVLEFVASANSDTIEVKVVSNPQNHEISDIKAEVESDIAQLLAS